MGFVKKHASFVNRLDDIQAIGSILTAHGSKACIIFSRKGVGKSVLVKKLLNKYSASYCCIKVTPAIKSPSQTENPGVFIQHIAFEMDKSSTSATNMFAYLRKTNDKETISSLKHILKENPKKRGFLSHVVSALAWVIPLIVGLVSVPIIPMEMWLLAIAISVALLGILQLILIISRNTWLKHKIDLARGKTDVAQKILKSTSDECFTIQRAFIESNLLRGGVLLNIENIQAIDQKSMNGLAQCISHSSKAEKNNHYLLEFTLDDSLYDVEKFTQTLENAYSGRSQNEIIFEQYELQPLSEDHIMQVVDEIASITDDVKDRVSVFWNNNADGNIIDLIYHVNLLISGSDQHHDSPITQFSKLPKQQKFALAIIVHSGGNLTQEQVGEYLVESHKDLRLEENDFKALEICNLIFLKNSAYYCQDTILKHWSIYESLSAPESAAALSYVERYYLESLVTPSANVERQKTDIQALFALYKKHSPDKIEALLPYMQEMSAQDFDIDYLKNSFATLKDYYLHNPPVLRVVYSVVQCCLSMNMYNEAWSFIEMVESTEETYIMCRAMLLNRMRQYNDAIIFSQSQLDCVSQRAAFILQQIILISLRSLNRWDECTSLFHQLLSKKNIKYPEYGFLLRNSEICLDVRSSCKYLKQSIRLFRKLKDKKNSALSELALGMQYARLGKPRVGQSHLDRARRLLSGEHIIAGHFYFVNSVAVALIRQQQDTQIWALLDRAELTAITDFEKLVIVVNRLAYCIMMDDKVRFDALLHLTETSNALPRITTISRSINYNIACWFAKHGDVERQEHYLVEARQQHAVVTESNPIGGPLGSVWSHRLCNDSEGLNEDLRFFADMPYHVSFISYWHFDVPNLDTHSES